MSDLIHDIDIARIYISSGHDFKGRHGKERLNHGTQSIDSAECVAGRGLYGDRFFDYREDFKGQITFFDRTVADLLEKTLGLEDFALSQLRRNVIVEGLDLNGLIGKRFEIGDVAFLGTEECAPCYWMDGALSPGAENLMKGRGGLRCRILSSGVLKRGPAKVKELR